MTDEQAAFIAAAAAFGRTYDSDVPRTFEPFEVADSIAVLARALYSDLRDMTMRRTEGELVEEIATLSSRLDARR